MPPDTPSRDEHVFTVSELTALITHALREAIPQATVAGEISNWRVSPAGHAYFKLRDDQATLSAVMFRWPRNSLAFEPEDGMRVIAAGAIDVYAPQGQHQIKVETMRPFGVGDLHLAFLRLKEKLEREGLFDPAAKKLIPRLPRRVGVVTSPTGAAIRDILNVLHRRFGNVHVIVAPVRVQGAEAPPEIVTAIERLNRLGGVDVMIVGRGGGSLEDLAAFNDERVARAIFDSDVPVISAVGHETDFTIADFVADLRAPTPSAAAELVVEEQSALLRRVGELRRRLATSTQGRVHRARLALDALASSHALTQPADLLHARAQRVDDLAAALGRATRHALARHRARWQPLGETLRGLDPEAIIERGYSVVTDDAGRVVRDTDQVKTDDALTVQLHRGRLGVRVSEKK